MMSLYAWKPAFQGILRPFVGWLATAGVTANHVTLAAGAASVLLGLGIFAQWISWLWLPLFLPARMAMNAMDGLLAREYGQASALGAVLNEALDIVSDVALTLPFVLVAPPWMVLAATVAACAVELAGLLSPGGRNYQGPFGKSDRALVLGVGGAWLGLGLPVADAALTAVPAAWMLLCAVTIVNRSKGKK